MKRNPITLVTAGVLAVIFILMLFAFQVRMTEVAVVTTFGKFTRSITEPGLYFRLPWPIQKIYSFDNRRQSFDSKLEQTTTKDAINLLVSVYVGWRVKEPRVFLESFNGDFSKAEQELEPLVRNVKNGIVGQYPLGALISTNVAQIQFDDIEKRILTEVQKQTEARYGVSVEILNIRQLGLPESITAKVFDRMRAERLRLVKKHQSDGEKEAAIIRATANSETNRILTYAAAEATKIRGEAEREAARSYSVFKQNPDLAIFLLQLRTLEQSLKERTTLILDQQTAPFNMLNSAPAKKN